MLLISRVLSEIRQAVEGKQPTQDQFRINAL